MTTSLDKLSLSMVSEPSFTLDGGIANSKMVFNRDQYVILQQIYDRVVKMQFTLNQRVMAQEQRGTTFELQQMQMTRPKELKLMENIDNPLGIFIELLGGRPNSEDSYQYCFLDI